MVMVEAALVIGMVGVVIYALASFLMRPGKQLAPTSVAGTWRVAHYDAKEETHIVLHKTSEGGRVLDEHVVAILRTDDPEYDEMFLAAMSTARQRQALFESEDGA